MALKLPKLPKMKMKGPKMPKLKSPKLPKLKAPKLPKMPTRAGIQAGFTSTFQGINIGYIVAVLFIIPIIMGAFVMSKIGFFGAGAGVGIANILGFLISLIGLLMTGISASMGPISVWSYVALLITISLTSYAIYSLPKEEKKE